MLELGAMIITGVSGLTLTEEEKDFIQDKKIGGVILFSHNYESPAQLAELVNDIQVLRDEYPLFICVDQEGGRVWRFKEHFTKFPAMNSIASLSSPKIVYETYKIIADELNICGINVNFAPVCEVLFENTTKAIGDRAFSDNCEEVSKFVSAAIRGIQTAGLLACAKHFPGHGRTSKDSHFDLPIIKSSLEDFQNVDFVPFFKASKSRVVFLMMSHIIVDSIDEKNPCTLSEKAYQLARDELKYKKIIVTDDMCMGALKKNFSIEDAAVRAIAAGADMLIYRDIEDAKKALIALQQASKTKELKNDKILDKISRIETVKKDFFSTYKPIYIPTISDRINTAENQKFLDDLLERLNS